MYRKQMTFQKILCFAALIMCAVIFVYSLGIMTDIYDLVRGKNNIGREADPYDTEVQGSWIYYDMQPFNRLFTRLSIGLFVLSVGLFITGTHSRRRYYIGNFISVAVFSICGIAFSAWCHLEIEKYRTQFLQMDFEALKAVADRMNGYYTESAFWFDIHWPVFILLVLVCVLLIANVFFKLSLMKAEKKLVAAGKTAGEEEKA